MAAGRRRSHPGEQTVASGARMVMGGRPAGEEFTSGNWYLPTVLVDVTPDMAAATEEIFGPVLPIISVSGYDEAVALANRRQDGLSAYLFTNDYRRFLDAADRLQVGTLFINRGITGLCRVITPGTSEAGWVARTGPTAWTATCRSAPSTSDGDPGT
jgi:lactaldehyde dehydrogenase/glycolaldehyde dehydrogenase